MKTLSNLIVVVLIIFSSSLKAQSRALKVGDDVPDYQFENVINYHSKKANIADFKGKLLILDFWSRGCASCIASWPKLEKLQKQFGDSIQILLVNPSDNENVVSDLLNKRKKANAFVTSLPIPCGDSSIMQLFPHRTVPHVVWISGDGKVKSITYSETLTSENVRAVINNKQVNFHQKANNDSLAQFGKIDVLKPFVSTMNGYAEDDMLCQSSIAKYNLRIPSTYGCYSLKETGYTIFAINTPIVYLYNYALSDKIYAGSYLEFMRPYRLKVLAGDPSKYTARNKDEETIYDNLRTYQFNSKVPMTMPELQRQMLQDLKMYFKLNVSSEEVNVPTLVFSVSDVARLPASVMGDELRLVSDVGINVQNLLFSDFIRSIENSDMYILSEYQFLDETNCSKLLGKIEIKENLSDPRKLSRALEKYGISVKIEQRPQRIFTLSE